MCVIEKQTNTKTNTFSFNSYVNYTLVFFFPLSHKTTPLVFFSFLFLTLSSRSGAASSRKTAAEEEEEAAATEETDEEDIEAFFGQSLVKKCFVCWGFAGVQVCVQRVCSVIFNQLKKKWDSGIPFPTHHVTMHVTFFLLRMFHT